MKIKQRISLTLWFFLAKYLPKSTYPIVGSFSKAVRFICAKLIFKQVGKEVNVENLAYFGNGLNISIDDYSGIGKKCRVPSNITI